MHGPDKPVGELIEILHHINGQEWNWRVLEFYGVGEMPNDLSVDEFEDLVDSSPHGIEFDWPGILEFAGSLEQTHDLVLVAVAKGQPLPTLSQNDWSSYPCAIEALDSYEWVITTQSGALVAPF
ncbi:hypothetical protein [Streptomyces erythrochromogenes]|uniref:hypothetical protein n=1 Tax=Streptomyces erythrochromogenes TaxID=285574 RepID=UPI003674CF03